ncbi:MAG: nicotinamide riboside transporter PnuC [Prevotellaceae bacterium]|jgi:nicotinamide mononucleotide transporter|nr:nicotinamide riboside transporter PnuC [Prevotellaceae bacterium]
MGDNILFSLWNFQVSFVLLIEVISSILSFLCILFAVKEKIWTFPLGMVSTAMYFFVFFMQELYSSMTLQIMFFTFNAYGLYKWTHPSEKDATKADNTLAVTLLKLKGRVLTGTTIVVLTLIFGYVTSNLFKGEELEYNYTYIPLVFQKLYKYIFLYKVYIDAFILSASLVAQYLMAIKKLESWAIWFLVDIIATLFYFITVGWATGILYFVFIFTAVMGWIEWKKSMLRNR